ncbi:MAG: signal recognition particle protein [Anaerolineaceae bacterium]|nr:signal recognition particle protein [Anaerolineaceae bacterium]
MFESLSERFDKIFASLKRKGKLSEKDVDTAMREVRIALLEADVHYSVVKKFVADVRERAIGVEVSEALNPGQQVIKIVNEELKRTLGEPERLNLSGEKPRVIMFVGLQGSGKTTHSAKVANKLRHQGERVLLVAADPYRPAAVKQLQTLGERIGVEVFYKEGVKPPDLAKQAYDYAKRAGFSVMIVDTAGRSQLDQALMDELQAIQRNIPINEILLVVDSMIGQEALNVAEGFRDNVNITGLVLSKMDGDSRGGAAISIRSVTGVPIKFIGTGEGIDAIESYDPSRLSSRILGMGDIIGLIEKAEAAFDANTEKQAKRMMSGQFTLEDFADQLKSMRKMGPISKLFDMLPGDLGKAARQVDPKEAEKSMKTTEAILSSMTAYERRNPDVLNASRKRRIAAGAGVDVPAVNRLLKQFRDSQKMMKMVKKTGGKGLSSLFR